MRRWATIIGHVDSLNLDPPRVFFSWLDMTDLQEMHHVPPAKRVYWAAAEMCESQAAWTNGWDQLKSKTYPENSCKKSLVIFSWKLWSQKHGSPHCSTGWLPCNAPLFDASAAHENSWPTEAVAFGMMKLSFNTFGLLSFLLSGCWNCHVCHRKHFYDLLCHIWPKEKHHNFHQNQAVT